MIYFHYNDGRVLQAVVLAFGERKVRVAVKGFEDSSEYRLIGQVWVSEDCELVRIEFAEGTSAPQWAPNPMKAMFSSVPSAFPLTRVM